MFAHYSVDLLKNSEGKADRELFLERIPICISSTLLRSDFQKSLQTPV
jgi:hypothetical protein